MDSKNITVTDGRLNKVLDRKINQVINSRKIPEMVDNKINKSKTHTGVILKFYPYKDKALVRLSDNTEVLCCFLHRMDGNLIDFFTPEGESSFCEDLKEPCIIPRAELHVMVADVNNGNDERLIQGFYQPKDITYIKPAANGCYKISNINPTNEFGLNIGRGNVEIKSLDGVNFTEGLFPSDEKDIVYANVEDTAKKEDTSNKVKSLSKSSTDKQYPSAKCVYDYIDEKINELREELGLEDNTGD